MTNKKRKQEALCHIKLRVYTHDTDTCSKSINGAVKSVLTLVKPRINE